MAQLRTQADAVMLGAGTARAERVGRMVGDPASQEERRRGGLAPEPLLCIISETLRLPPDLPALRAQGHPVLIVTASSKDLGELPADVDYLRVPAGPIDMTSVLEELRRTHGVRSVLCEGGPTLNSSLFAEDLVDELFLTVADKLLGGVGGLTIVAGRSLSRPAELDLVRVLESDGQLFLRMRVRRP
jgi:riboflavin biosynthesis pyrimidine reductase